MNSPASARHKVCITIKSANLNVRVLFGESIDFLGFFFGDKVEGAAGAARRRSVPRLQGAASAAPNLLHASGCIVVMRDSSVCTQPSAPLPNLDYRKPASAGSGSV